MSTNQMEVRDSSYTEQWSKPVFTESDESDEFWSMERESHIKRMMLKIQFVESAFRDKEIELRRQLSLLTKKKASVISKMHDELSLMQTNYRQWRSTNCPGMMERVLSESIDIFEQNGMIHGDERVAPDYSRSFPHSSPPHQSSAKEHFQRELLSTTTSTETPVNSNLYPQYNPPSNHKPNHRKQRHTATSTTISHKPTNDPNTTPMNAKSCESDSLVRFRSPEIWYLEAAVVGCRYLSIVDGRLEFRAGVPIIQHLPPPPNTYPVYVYKTPSEARNSIYPEDSALLKTPRVIVALLISGEGYACGNHKYAYVGMLPIKIHDWFPE